MKLYKLTDQNGYTRKSQPGQTKWSAGFSLELPTIKKPELCTNQVIHAYKNINLAFLLNPIHASIKNPRLWEAEGDITCEEWDKVGCFRLTIINEIQVPAWVNSHKKEVQVRFAILCAESVLKCFEDKYPSDNRPRKAIEAAKEYLKNPSADAARAADAADAASRAAAHAAYAASHASHAAAHAAYAAYAARAADAADAADAASRAAAHAAYAARASHAAYAADAASRAAAHAAYAARASHAAYAIDFGQLADAAVEAGISNSGQQKRSEGK